MPSQPRQPHADQPHLLVRVDRVVAAAPARDAAMVTSISASSTTLVDRRADRHLAARTAAAARGRCAGSGSVDVAADRIGDQIDAVPELDQRLDAVVFAERRAARLEERLGREHQDAKRSGRRGHSARVADSRILLVYHPDRRFLLTRSDLCYIRPVVASSPAPRDGAPSTPSERSSPLLRRVLFILLKLSLSVGLMAFVLRDTSLASLWAMLRRVQPGWAIAALAPTS